MMLSQKRITKALIRLHGCSGWYVPVLFANLRRLVFLRRGPYNKSKQVINQTDNIVGYFFCANVLYPFFDTCQCDNSIEIPNIDFFDNIFTFFQAVCVFVGQNT